MSLITASKFRLRLIAGLATAAALIAPLVAVAQEHYDLPAGTACDFPVSVDSVAHPNDYNPYREVYDRNGNLIRIFFGGRGDAVRFTNEWSKKSFTWKGSGDNYFISPVAPDQTVAITRNGGMWITWTAAEDFGTPGPAIYIFTGHIAYTVDLVTFFWTLNEFKGRKTDVCAILGG